MSSLLKKMPGCIRLSIQESKLRHVYRTVTSDMRENTGLTQVSQRFNHWLNVKRGATLACKILRKLFRKRHNCSTLPTSDTKRKSKQTKTDDKTTNRRKRLNSLAASSHKALQRTSNTSFTALERSADLHILKTMLLRTIKILDIFASIMIIILY